MHIQYEILYILQKIENNEYSEACQALISLEEKTINEYSLIETIFVEGFRSSQSLKLFAKTDQSLESENFCFHFSNFLIKVVTSYAEHFPEYLEDLLETSYSGYVCAKSAKLKESWLRLLRKSLNHIIGVDIDSAKLHNYEMKLFDQLASKHSQSVMWALCLTLTAIVSHLHEEKSYRQLTSFLKKLLAEKFSQSTRKPEFVVISAALSSLAKLIRMGEFEPEKEDMVKFYEYSERVLLSDLDKMIKYKPISSACKLLSVSVKTLEVSDLDQSLLVVRYLQSLIDHRNASVAKCARWAYIALLKCYARTQQTGDSNAAGILAAVSPFLVQPSGLDDFTVSQLAFRLKSLSTLIPLLECANALDAILWTAREATRLVDEISGSPTLPNAYALPDLIETMANVLVNSSVLPQSLHEAAWKSLKLALIASFEAYPKLSQRITEITTITVLKTIEKLQTKEERVLTELLIEAFYHALLQTCSHSPPLDLDDDQSDDESAESPGDKAAEGTALESHKQPDAQLQAEVAIPPPSFREYLPLWRSLLEPKSRSTNKSAGTKSALHPFLEKRDGWRNNLRASLLAILLKSAIAILRRLDFSYEEGTSQTSNVDVDLDTQVVVKNPHDVLLLSNIALFLEELLCNCSSTIGVDALSSLLQTCFELVERYPLLSGLYRLLKLAILLTKKSGLFYSESQKLKSFSQVLLKSFERIGSLSDDDLSTARCACFLILPLSVMSDQPGTTLFNQLAHVVSSAIQLVGYESRCATLAMSAVSAVESWLTELDDRSEIFSTAFAVLVQPLVGLLEMSHDEPINDKAVPTPTGQYSIQSRRRADLQKSLKTLTKQNKRINSNSSIKKAQVRVLELIGRYCIYAQALHLVKDQSSSESDNFVNVLQLGKGVFNNLTLCLPFPDLRPTIKLTDFRTLTRILPILLWRPKTSSMFHDHVKTTVSRQARVCAAEYLHEYIVFGLTKQPSLSADPNEPIRSSDSVHWRFLFHTTFILGVDTDPLIRRLFRCLAFQLVRWFAGYPIAGLHEAQILLRVVLQNLSLCSPEDDVCGTIDSKWPLPDSMQTARTRLSSVCLREFLQWMNSEIPGNKRRHASLGDRTVDNLIQEILDGLLKEGAAPNVFTDTIGRILSDRPELAIRSIYLLIETFRESTTSSGSNPSQAALKQAVNLLIDLIKKFPESFQFEDFSGVEKRPRLMRASEQKPNIESNKPPTWGSPSISACIKALLQGCHLAVDGRVFHEIVLQILSASNMRLVPTVYSDLESLVESLEVGINSSNGLINCLNTYAWLLTSCLVTNAEFVEMIHHSRSRILLVLRDACEFPDRLNLEAIGSISTFISAALHLKPKLELAVVFAADHTIWKYLPECILMPTKMGISGDKAAEQMLDICKSLSNSDVNALVGSMNFLMEPLASESIPSVLSDLTSDKASEFADLIYSVSNLVTSLKSTSPLIGYFKQYISTNLCDTVMKSLRETTDCSGKNASKLFESLVSIAACLNYQITVDTNLLSSAIDQSMESRISPANLLSVLGFKDRSEMNAANIGSALSVLLKFLLVYSREPITRRIGQLCEGIANTWGACVEPLVRTPEFDQESCVNLLEALISLSPVELDRNAFVNTYQHLIDSESRKVAIKVRLLDMLAFFLQGDVTPPTLSLSSECRKQLVESAKLLLASSLPLDQQEIAASSTKLTECSTLLKSILSLLKTSSCSEAIQILTVTFCRHEKHFMDEELDLSLREAMKRIWTLPLLQYEVLNNALEDFEQACTAARSSSAFLNLWHRYFDKFLTPLLISVGPAALERLAINSITKWTQTLDAPVPSNETQWLWGLLRRIAAFYLIAVIYNRLPKSKLHGLTGGGVGSVLKAFLSPEKTARDLQTMQCKGTELTAFLIKKAYNCLQDHSLQPPNVTCSSTDYEATAATLKHALWSASLACIVATISATQTQEKAYNYLLSCDPISRFVSPKATLCFPRRRSGRYRSAFLELREAYWSPSERDPYLTQSAILESRKSRGFSNSSSRSGGLLQGSSFSVEINRFMRSSGTQIVSGSEFKVPRRPSISGSPPILSPPGTQEESRTISVNLEVDCLNTASAMVSFVCLLKHMHTLRLLKATSGDLPPILRFLYDQFNSPKADDNARVFVVKLVVNCSEVFKPFHRHWLPLLLTYTASGAECLLDSHGPSALCIDLCLLLADWNSTSLPASEVEKTAARGVLTHLLKHSWISVTESVGGGDGFPEGVAAALKHNLELLRLLTDAWLPCGVDIPYRELLSELQASQESRRLAFAFQIFKTFLAPSSKFNPETDNLPLVLFVDALLKNLSQSQKSILTAVWECSGLLIAKSSTATPSFTGGDGRGQGLQSRGLQLLSLSQFPTDLHPLMTELWSGVTKLMPSNRHRRGRSTDGPTANPIEVACAAASHWPMLAVHLTNSLLATGIADNIEPSTLVQCLKMFTTIVEAFSSSNSTTINLDKTVKVEIVQTIVKSNIFEIVRWGTTVVLFHGYMLVLRVAQFLLNDPAVQNEETLDLEARIHMILRLVQALISTLARPNSTSNSRQVAYRIFVEIKQKNNGVWKSPGIEGACNLGLTYGLCAEEDSQLRRQLRKYVSRHCLDAPLSNLSTSTSLSHCVQTLLLLGGGGNSQGSLDRGETGGLLAGGVGRHWVSTCLDMILEPAVKSAEFRHAFRQAPLDPHYPFTETNSFTRTSITASQSRLDPLVWSGTQQLKASHTQVLDPGSATLALPQGDTVIPPHIMETQVPPTSTSSAFTPMDTTQFTSAASTSSFSNRFFGSQDLILQRRKSRDSSFDKLPPVEKLRRKFHFAASLAAQSPESKKNVDSVREFFKKRAIERQHAETSLSTVVPEEESARLCRRHRLGALPDVEKLTPEALLKPLFQLANCDPNGCGVLIMTQVLEAIITSVPNEDLENFMWGLGSALAGLLVRGQGECLSMIWTLGSVDLGGVGLSLFPDPRLLAATAIEIGQSAAGALVIEEAFCAAAAKASGLRDSSMGPTPWTASRRRLYPPAMPAYILPHEEIPVAAPDAKKNTSTAAICWWQLNRLYADTGRSDELLGWLGDRWVIGSKSAQFMEGLGRAINVKTMGNFEESLKILRELIDSFPESDDKPEDSVEDLVEDFISDSWAIDLDAELRLVCREEELQCLERLGSWQQLDAAATSTALLMAVPTESCKEEPATSETIHDELVPIWKDPYLFESVVPQIIHSRLKGCLTAEIDRVLQLNQTSSGSDASADRFCHIMESGLHSAPRPFESRFAYELALLSVLRRDFTKARLYCKTAFKELTQTWSEEPDRRAGLQKTQLLTELKEFLDVASTGEGFMEAESALSLLQTWLERSTTMPSDEELTTPRLFYASEMVEIGILSAEEHLLPKAIDLRLACANETARSGNASRAIGQLAAVKPLVERIGKLDGRADEYRQLAWCNALSRAWTSAYEQEAAFCHINDKEGVSNRLRHGLVQCLTSSSECITSYDNLQGPISLDSKEAAVAQFSHAASTAGALSVLYELQMSGRLDDSFASSLQPTLEGHFSLIHGFGDFHGSKADFFKFAAFEFFKKCVDLAMGVWSSSGRVDSITTRNLLVQKPEEALLEVADFCDARFNEESENREMYADMFTRSVLTSMRMGSEDGKIRLGRVIQVEMIRCSSPSSGYNPQVFCDLTRDLPPRMFAQWIDRVLQTAAVKGGVGLVADILRRFVNRYPQTLALPLRVLLSSGCAFTCDEGELVERFLEKLVGDEMSDAVPIFTELTNKISKHANLRRFLAELEFFDDPDLVLKDWVNDFASKILRSSQADRVPLVTSCAHLVQSQFQRLPCQTTLPNEESARYLVAQSLSLSLQKVFGEDYNVLLTISPTEFETYIQQILNSCKETNQNEVKTSQFSKWLANFSAEEHDLIEMPGQALSSNEKAVVTIQCIDPSVKVLASLRRPKLLRVRGSDGRWRGWMVKGGEDLRQDASIQRLLGFANYAIAASPGNTPSLRTYAVLPVSSSRGIIQWLEGTTTLAAFCNDAMTVHENMRFSGERAALCAELDKFPPDNHWSPRYEEAQASLVSRFVKLEKSVFALRLLRRGLRVSMATSAEHFATLRHRLVTSHSSICAVHYILGVGDRHLGNFLLDRATGSLVGIDFGYVFGLTLSFPSPEYVPLRLTSSLRELLEPAGPAGVFGAALGRGLAALRHHRSLFLSAVQTYIEDKSITGWSTYSSRYGQSEESYRQSRVELIRRKLAGQSPAGLLIDDLSGRFGSFDWFDRFATVVGDTVSSSTPEAHGSGRVSPTEQARQLVCLSTCPELLARMRSGWNAAV